MLSRTHFGGGRNASYRTHFKNMDSRLNPDEVKLCLDPNEDHSHVKYALHFAVGFGSQVAFSLFYSS